MDQKPSLRLRMKSRDNFKTSSTLRETGTVDRRRALQVLASCDDGATEAALSAHGATFQPTLSAQQDLGEVAPGTVGRASAKAAP
jgi:hypothetical protein